MLPREVTDRVVNVWSERTKIRKIEMLGKSISGILMVVDHVGCGYGPPRRVLMVSDHLVKPVAHDWKVTECKLVENEEIPKLHVERF